MSSNPAGEQEQRPARGIHISRRSRLAQRLSPFVIHGILLTYTLLTTLPVLLVVMNSFKAEQAIFNAPFTPPNSETFDLSGYATVFTQTNALLYFRNSLVVTLISIVLILLFGAMASFALTEYRFPGNTALSLYLMLGLMIPIRLGTVSILQLIVELGLQNTIWSLILVYIAQGLPLAIFVLSQFMRQVPRDLKEAARIDGASEYRVFRLIFPLTRPALASLAVFIMIPIWNDLWFPLILTSSEESRTLTLGAQQFLGQYQTDWNGLLAMLTLAIVPVVLLYMLFSRQLMRGLTAGAVK